MTTATSDRNFDRFAEPIQPRTIKSDVMRSLRAFLDQRPSLEFANYGAVAAYRSDSRRITQQLNDAKILCGAVEMRSVSGSDLIEAIRADSRLSIRRREDLSFELDYTTGQYWPIEYRAAVCRVLSRALWAYWRADGIDPRKAARQYLGRGIASRWFA